MVSNKRGIEEIFTASDDGTVKCWDLRAKNYIDSLNFGYPLTAIEFSQ